MEIIQIKAYVMSEKEILGNLFEQASIQVTGFLADIHDKGVIGSFEYRALDAHPGFIEEEKFVIRGVKFDERYKNFKKSPTGDYSLVLKHHRTGQVVIAFKPIGQDPENVIRKHVYASFRNLKDLSSGMAFMAVNDENFQARLNEIAMILKNSAQAFAFRMQKRIIKEQQKLGL